MDIQVVRLFDVVAVDGIREAAGVSPRSIILRGTDFTSAEQVLINGFPSPEFVTYSDIEMVAQVPSAIIDQQVLEVFVLSKRLTLTQRSLVELTFGTRPESTNGILKLVQNFTRMLIRSPGTNYFNKTSGGGLFKKIGATIGGGDARDRAVADAVIAVNRTASYMIQTQAPLTNITPAERLLSAKVVAAEADPQNGSIALSVELVSHSGLRGVATLVR